MRPDTFRLVYGVLSLWSFSIIRSRAYTPAVATNETSSLNTSAYSVIVQWPPSGIYSANISYQVIGSTSLSAYKGALVHFSENNLTSGETTTTPWLAAISCDSNTTASSPSSDIFTLAQAQGATAALLYSTTSETCHINEAYADRTAFTPALDVFVTRSRSTSLDLENEFQPSDSPYYWFNPDLLTDSENVVNSFIQSGAIGSTPGFPLYTIGPTNDKPTNTIPNPKSHHSVLGRAIGACLGVIVLVLFFVSGCLYLRRRRASQRKLVDATSEMSMETSAFFPQGVYLDADTPRQGYFDSEIRAQGSVSILRSEPIINPTEAAPQSSTTLSSPPDLLSRPALDNTAQPAARFQSHVFEPSAELVASSSRHDAAITPHPSGPHDMSSHPNAETPSPLDEDLLETQEHIIVPRVEIDCMRRLLGEDNEVPPVYK